MCKHILINRFTANDLGTLSRFTAMTHDMDGFGAILRLVDGTIETRKSLNPGEFYLGLTQRLLKGDTETLVVHHRTSTNLDGLDYAHPFEFQGHHLTHNGVVSVPGVHETKTQNDSEALLHHLIKTGYDTEAISGYFSCFMLTERETTVLVDQTAPLYSDGRVYSSHKLGDGFTKLELVRQTLDTHGTIVAETPIKVTRSVYGLDQADKSLGPVYRTDWDAWDYRGYPLDMPGESNVDRLLGHLTNREETYLERAVGDEMAFLARAVELAWSYGIEITEADGQELLEYFGY